MDNCQDLEIAQVPIGRRGDKKAVVQSCTQWNRTHPMRKEGNRTFGGSVEGPAEHHAR